MLKSFKNILTALLAITATGAVLFNSVAVNAQSASTASQPKSTVGQQKPDFAFPDKVAADANANLSKALTDGDGAGVVNALVRFSLARNQVSPDLLPEAMARIDSVARVEKDECVKSLLNLLQANIYNEIYSNNKWSFDQRQIPLDSLSADFNAWSGEQFRARIVELLTAATSPRDRLLASPLADWSSIIIANEYTYIFYPTLYDLVAYKAIDIYNNLGTPTCILPFRTIFNAVSGGTIPAKARIDSYMRKANLLCESLVKAHAGHPAADITARIRMINCLETVTFDTDNCDMTDVYMQLYNMYSNTEWGAEALIACNYYDRNSSVYISALRDAINRFPNYYRVNALRERLNQLERPSVSSQRHGNVTPGKPFNVSLSIDNTDNVQLKFYRIGDAKPGNDRSAKTTKEMRANPTLSISIDLPSRPKPFSTDTIVSATLQQPGSYYMWVESDSIENDDSNYASSLTCTDIAPIIVSFNGKSYPYAVNSFNGSPMPGITISDKSYKSDVFKVLGITSNDGTTEKPISENAEIRFQKDRQEISLSVYGSYYHYKATEWSTNGKIFTSLPLYHHGDSVDWAVIAYQNMDKAHRPYQNGKLRITVEDANYSEFYTVNVTTDETGRACGKFKLPDEGLSGYYHIYAYVDKDNTKSNKRSYSWNSSFMVNDYKLPTFEATVTDVKRSTNPDSAISVTCKAETYSGFPLDHAKVEVNLAASQSYWWRYSSDMTIWSTDSVTASDGTLNVVIPQDILDLSPYGPDNFSINFKVTSASGETASCQRSINTGKPYGLVSRFRNTVNIEKPLDGLVTVFNAMGDEAKLPLVYSIVTGNDTIKLGDDRMIPASVKAGIYDIIVTPVDTTLADTLTLDDVICYRTKGNTPSDSPLFTPVSQYDATGDTQRVLFGSGIDNANILVVTTVDDTIAKREWIKPKKGMQYYSVGVPADCTKIQVEFATVYNNCQYDSKIDIYNKRTERNLKIAVESFRDKVIPGTPERITLKVSENDEATKASMMLLMESKALLKLESHSLNLQVSNPGVPYLSTSNYNRYSYNTISSQLPQLNYPQLVEPRLNFYGLSFNPRSYRIYGYRRANAMGATCFNDGTDDLQVVREDKEEIAVCEDEAVAESAPLYETVVTGYAAEKKSAVTGSVSVGKNDNFNYRPSEIPLAFFAPMLSTDADGTLTYTYNVPQANTSWALKALAYTPGMLTATLERTVVASRPVMVQPTLPRFLRYGDSTSFRATVMNAADSAQLVTTTVSVLNPADMSVITTMTATDSIAAHSSTTIATPFNAPAGGQAVIYRIKSSAGDYSDGEQSVIPLLPATQPVITSETFFIPADSTDVSLEISTPGAGESTLYMYDNPLWEVLAALPSLNRGEAVSAPAAMNNIYIAAVARGILSKNPAIKQGLKDWLESDRADSTLTSMLSRNDDLKQIAIGSTPWAREAMSDKERLTSLALILDDSNIQSTLKQGIKTLSNLKAADGGIAWCTGFNWSSEWATYRVLTLAASLNERGYLPNDKKLDEIIKGALVFIDNETAKDFKRSNGRGDYTRYAYLRSILRDNPATIKKSAIDRTISNILKRWQTESAENKALDAVILYRNNYPSMARRVVASIKSYAMSSPAKGTWWNNTGVNATASLLYTIETVTPGDKELINSVAQWLILNKTNRSWGDNAGTSAAIDALLGTIDTKRAVNGTTSVSIDGKTIANYTPQLPGMTVADVTGIITGKKSTLSVAKTTGLPAMGSVITRSVMSLDSIPTSAHPSVKIEKRINVVRGAVVTSPDALTVGDRAKVQLVLTVTDDLDYVTIVDRKAACMEPVDQLSGYTHADRLRFYREVTDSETRFYIDRLPRGTYVIDTDMNIVSEGSFASGVATLQSQLNPGVVANSSSKHLSVSLK